MYKSILRPIFFQFDPEKVHHFTFSLIRCTQKIPGMRRLIQTIYQINDPRLEREVMGLKFKNPVGLAAGLDKDAKIYNELDAFGFGFIEIGTITPKPQDGNPKKRLFRLKEDSGIINRIDRKSTRLNSSHVRISYAVFCLKKKKKKNKQKKKQKKKKKKKKILHNI